MATTISPTSFPMTSSMDSVMTISAAAGRRRRIDQHSGRALEILGHAIEYLTDEFVHEGALLTSNGGQVAAIQLLMSLNRQVYFECPVAPTVAERFMSLLGVRAA